MVTITQVVDTQVGTNRMMSRPVAGLPGPSSFCVGGASIANYMYANVFERRREIGTLHGTRCRLPVWSCGCSCSKPFSWARGRSRRLRAGHCSGDDARFAQLAGITVMPMPSSWPCCVVHFDADCGSWQAFLPARDAARLDPCADPTGDLTMLQNGTGDEDLCAPSSTRRSGFRQSRRSGFTMGDFVAIVGPSGSGKSTLLLMLGGMLSPSSGRVFIDGQSVYDLSTERSGGLAQAKIGFVFQTFNLVPYLSALENVQIPLFLAGCRGVDAGDAATRLLERVGLGDRLDHKPGELSVGQQQRVALARMLANDPADHPGRRADRQPRPGNRQRVCSTSSRSLTREEHDRHGHA